ncbi:hypothetical protein EON79_04720 [bacterium]|nr:MAG: hypothetical protein EON79_04720 [bacterium]
MRHASPHHRGAAIDRTSTPDRRFRATRARLFPKGGFFVILLPVQSQALRPYEFVFVAPAGTKSVSVAGTFNGWNKDAHPMTADADGKTYRRRLDIPVGKVQYKFVLDGERWIVDPNGKTIDDGNGNQNTELVILPDGYSQPSSPNDDSLTGSGLLHETNGDWINYDRGRLTFKLRSRENDLRAATLRISALPSGKEAIVPLQRVSRSELFDTWQGSIPWDGKSPTHLVYSFKVESGKADWSYHGTISPPMSQGGFEVKPHELPFLRTPAWIDDAIIYQIFPDRFANGSRENDPKDVQAWDTKPTYSNRFGGDIEGIKRHIPYLKGLGISALYLNPVFKSPSNHRYEADDFRLIDPQLGTNKEFGQLTQSLRKAGIRPVMDWSLNHSSPEFHAFRDVREKGAASPYASWYNVYSYPVRVQDNPNYEAWYGFPSMPKFRVMNPPTQKYLLDLVGFWRKEAPGLGGIRLDVANEVEPAFWRLFRKEVKGQDANLWIVGEHWGDSRPWLQGDQWDGAMNYPFREAVVQWIAQGTTKPSQFLDRLFEVYGWYSPQANRAMLNLIGSHDTPRFRTLAEGDAKLAMLGATILLTWIGSPSIYYGDEVGMEGEKDPDNRRGMRWDLVGESNPVYRHYQKLIAARRSSKALRGGDPVRLGADDSGNTVAYGRVFGKDAAIVAINRSAEARTVKLDLPVSLARKAYVDVLSGARLRAGDSISISLPPYGSAVLTSGSNASPLSSLRPRPKSSAPRI